MQIPYEIIQNLIATGRKGPCVNDELLSYFKNKDFINRLNNQSWYEDTTSLDNSEIIDLFKGLILVENRLKWLGGSVAGAIWVYRIIQFRRLDEDYGIADFGFKNSSNPYIPFGVSYHGPRTVKEYFSFKEEEYIRKENKVKAYKQLLTRCQGRKIRRAAEISELRKLSKEKRGQIRSELLQKYKNSSVADKLEIIASDPIFPPEYYPIEWITVSEDEVKHLPVTLIKRLYDKLSTKTRGEWRRFSISLQKFDDGM